MSTRFAIFGLATTLAVAVLPQSVSAQYRRVDPRRVQNRGKGTDDNDVRRGQYHGRVTSVKTLAGGGLKQAIVGLQLDGHRTATVAVRDGTSISVRHTELSGRKATPFLVEGVTVDVDWIELRNARAGSDGEFANRIEILAEEIEGIVQSMTESAATVVAQPRKETKYERDEPSKLRVSGREPSKPAGKPTAEPKPTRLKLSFRKDITTFTLNGASAKVSEVVKAVKASASRTSAKTGDSAQGKSGGPAFEAVVVAGGGNAVVQFHVRDGEGEKPGNPAGEKPSKTK